MFPDFLGAERADLRQVISEVSGKHICWSMEFHEYISATEMGTNTSQSLCQELGQILTKINMKSFSRRNTLEFWGKGEGKRGVKYSI